MGIDATAPVGSLEEDLSVSKTLRWRNRAGGSTTLVQQRGVKAGR